MKQKSLTINTSFSFVSTWYIILCIIIFCANTFINNELLIKFFSATTNQSGLDSFKWNQLSSYIRFLSHIFGNNEWTSLALNSCIILYAASSVEEKYSKLVILFMISICAITSGVLNACFSTKILFGADGITCMYLMLYKKYEIDKKQFSISYLFLVVFFLGNLLNISIKQMSLNYFYGIIGALCGFLFGALSITVSKPKKD